MPESYTARVIAAERLTSPVAELERRLTGWGQPRFRARQIAEWKYRRLAGDWDEMHNLPADLRAKLTAEVPFSSLRPVTSRHSADGRTTKTLFQLWDGQRIETVLMRQRASDDVADRNTICVSSQAGCKMRCSFCATGHGGWRRDLSAEEIVDQVLHFARILRAEGRRVSN